MTYEFVGTKGEYYFEQIPECVAVIIEEETIEIFGIFLISKSAGR